MAMRNSDVSFMRREVIPILTAAAHLTPDAAEVLNKLNDRINWVLEPKQASWEINRWFEKHTETGDFAGWHCTLAYDGQEVPYITGTYWDRGEHEGQISLTLDRRFGLSTTLDELGDWIMFLANAMAVSAGRTSHGPNSYIRNPHGRSGGGDPPDLGASVVCTRPGDCIHCLPGCEIDHPHTSACMQLIQEDLPRWEDKKQHD